MKLLLLISVLFVAKLAVGTYLITTPRRWPQKDSVQICATLLDGAVFNSRVDEWHISIRDALKPKEILKKQKLSLPEGKTMACRDIRRPKIDSETATLKIEGRLAGTNFSEEVNVTIGSDVFRTYIQPDKAIYKPGQKVQFRMLTIEEIGAPFKFSAAAGIWTQPYEVVYIESPKRIRIAQWRNVSNDGLVHLSFDLHDEAEQGRYNIFVDHGLDKTYSADFNVEYYTLPRYEVTVTSPEPIYGNSAEIKLKLCAKYTFGQNVRGNGTLSVSVGSFSRTYANITKHAHVDGCTDFVFPTKTLRFDDNNCHIRISTIKVEGRVVEEGVNNVIHIEPKTFLVNRKVINFADVTKTGTGKSYLPTAVTVRSTFPDSSPAANEKIETCTYLDGTNICRNFTTDANGELQILIPNDHNSGVQFRAVNYPSLEKNFNFVMRESNQYFYGNSDKKFTDAHNASVSIYYFDKLTCEDGKQIQVNLPIIYITDGQKSANIKVQTMSNGYVQSLHNETIQLKNTPMPFNLQQFLVPLKPVPNNVIRGMTNISFTLPLTASPEVTITVWFKTTKNSVVADTLRLEVTPCLGNAVDLSFSVNETGPGTPVTMKLTAEKNSLCSIGVVDKSVELLGAPDKLSAKAILKALDINRVRHWDEKQLDLKYCLKKYKNEKAANEIARAAATNRPSVYRTSVPYRRNIEAIQVFQDAGYHVFSPLNLEKQTCDDLLFKVLKSLAEVNTNLRPIAFSGGFQGDNKVLHRPPPVQFDAPPQSLSISNKEGTVTEEAAPVRTNFPETWLWELRTIGSQSNELSETVTVPDTITEWVGSAVCIGRETGIGISNEASITTFTPFFVELNLPPKVKRGEHFPVVISVFSYSKSPLSVNLQLEKSPDFDFVDVAGTTENGERSFCLDKFQKFVRTVIIKPKVIGDMNITVEALSNKAIANCFDPNAQLKSDRIIKPILVEPEGVTREKVWTRYVCPEDSPNKDLTWNVSLPTGIVADSERAWVNVIGDLLGPSLKNLGSLVNMPYGCGEQNLITFVPNVFILDYMNASNQLNPELEDRLKLLMNYGYQRQLKYARKDGSFSTFGEIDDNGSTWLTAFVLKSFAQADRYIDIDQNVIRKSIAFLKGNQRPDGCFDESGKVINKAIMGDSPSSGESLLTAYVVGALEEANLNATDRNMISKALPCILKDESVHPYNLALRAYSLAVAKSPEANRVIEQLKVLAVTTDSEMSWNIPGSVKNSALSVETASYGLLSFLLNDQKAHTQSSRKIVRWLSSQRNGRGGFVSTQDTVMGLQALSLFERLQPSKEVDVTATVKNGVLNNAFKVNKSNKLVEQRQDIHSPKQLVNFNIQGTGCAIVQGVLRYNVLSKSSDKFFSLNVSSVVDSNCEYHTITSCTSYLLSDNVSNMANMEVNLVTGYKPVENDLREVVLNAPFKRYEIDQGKIIFYLDEISSKPVCASFRVTQDLIVGNAQPGIVKVYDYYQPELANEKTFDLKACKTSYKICIDPLTQRPVNTQSSNNDLC